MPAQAGISFCSNKKEVPDHASALLTSAKLSAGSTGVGEDI